MKYLFSKDYEPKDVQIVFYKDNNGIHDLMKKGIPMYNKFISNYNDYVLDNEVINFVPGSFVICKNSYELLYEDSLKDELDHVEFITIIDDEYEFKFINLP